MVEKKTRPPEAGEEMNPGSGEGRTTDRETAGALGAMAQSLASLPALVPHAEKLVRLVEELVAEPEPPRAPETTLMRMYREGLLGPEPPRPGTHGDVPAVEPIRALAPTAAGLADARAEEARREAAEAPRKTEEREAPAGAKPPAEARVETKTKKEKEEAAAEPAGGGASRRAKTKGGTKRPAKRRSAPRAEETATS